MSDFLRNLRSSQKKKTSDRKRNLDGHYYPQNDRRTVPDRRTEDRSESMESLLASIQDMLPEFIDTSSSLIQNLEQMVSQNELLMETKIRHYNAISIFFNNLNKIFSEDLFVQQADKPQKPTASYASGTHYTKDDILTIIRTMRKKGATFAAIASYLETENIPTFSGRGDWHAQTIHRLCKGV